MHVHTSEDNKGCMIHSDKFLKQKKDESSMSSFLVAGCEISYPEVTGRCRLSWLTNSALVNEPNYGGRGVAVGWVVSCRDSANEHSCAHGAQLNFRDLTRSLHI
jgi:hypothetical protein